MLGEKNKGSVRVGVAKGKTNAFIARLRDMHPHASICCQYRFLPCLINNQLSNVLPLAHAPSFSDHATFLFRNVTVKRQPLNPLNLE